MEFVHYPFKHFRHAESLADELNAAGLIANIMLCADDDGRDIHAVHAYYKDWNEYDRIKAIAKPHDDAERKRNAPVNQ